MCLRAPRARASREYVFTAGGACARLVCVRRGSNTGLTYKSPYTYCGHQVSLAIEAGAKPPGAARQASRLLRHSTRLRRVSTCVVSFSVAPNLPRQPPYLSESLLDLGISLDCIPDTHLFVHGMFSRSTLPNPKYFLSETLYGSAMGRYLSYIIFVYLLTV